MWYFCIGYVCSTVVWLFRWFDAMTWTSSYQRSWKCMFACGYTIILFFLTKPQKTKWPPTWLATFAWFFFFLHILQAPVKCLHVCFLLLLLFWVWFCGFLMIEILDYGYVEVRNKTTNVCDEKHLTAASWSAVKKNWSQLMGQRQTPTYWIWNRDSPKSLNKTAPAEGGLCGC